MDKTYVFEGTGGSDANMTAMLSGLLNKSNLDPNLVAALMNGNNQNAMGGGGMGFIWIILLFFLFGRNGLGNDTAQQLNNDSGRELLMNAIQGNGTAISQLASNLNTSTTALQSAICGVNNTLTSLGGQIGMTTQQIINAIQQGNCQLATQTSDGFCRTNSAITTQGYENRLAEANQTNTLVNTMNANNQTVINRIDAFEHSQLEQRIQALQEKNQTLQLEISQRNQNEYIAGVIAPVNTRLAAIECHQLPTYPQTYIPGQPTMQYAAPYYPYPYGAPFYGGGCCENKNW